MESRKAEKTKRSRRAGNINCNHGRKAQQEETKIERWTYKTQVQEEDERKQNRVKNSPEQQEPEERELLVCKMFNDNSAI